MLKTKNIKTLFRFKLTIYKKLSLSYIISYSYYLEFELLILSNVPTFILLTNKLACVPFCRFLENNNIYLYMIYENNL